MKNEALRLFLAVAALIITAMITNTSGSLTDSSAVQRSVAGQDSESNIEQTATDKTPQKSSGKTASRKKGIVIKTVHKANRSFAFFYRR